MPVSYSADGAVATITLDNPPANSYDIELMRELADAIARADGDADIRVAVLRSASEKFFSAGADVKRFLANDADANVEMVHLAHEALASIARSGTLFVAWIAGHALGGGLEMASRATCATPPRARTASGRPRSRSGCCRATAARSACRASSAPARRSTSC